ncbi:MAG TPA: APC family permease [Pirellulaceae bacterium]|nr:APC family permease [Pirellulaceae bacterium]
MSKDGNPANTGAKAAKGVTTSPPIPAVREVHAEHEIAADVPTISEKVATLLVGKPLDLRDRRIYHHISLVAFLAWVGLGADGLSSSCYGPSEAFHHLSGHHHLAIFLAFATMFTVWVISACYSHIIEAFPSGGGGYLVASKMLGRPFGVVSGSALVVDYVLTVTVSVAAAGDALLGLAGPQWQGFKLPLEFGAIVVLIVLNLRGVKESVTILMPIFLVFLLTHAILIAGAIGLHLGALGSVASDVVSEVRTNIADPQLGLLGMIGLLLYAYSLGAGTYTGIEAVSNSMPVMREPKVATAQRTMFYMAVSLALTAGGLMLAYLLLKLTLPENAAVTMNQLLTERFVAELGVPQWLGIAFIFITMLSEGALLVVAAQAGFIDGPRVLANMAHDSYVPHWFGSLSERLAARNGILLIGIAALVALWATGGSVSTLVVMYSINVFLTFSLSMIGMAAHWYRQRRANPLWRRRFVLFVAGATLCLSILAVNIYFKVFYDFFYHGHGGGWMTIAVTGILAGTCFLIHRYYGTVTARLKTLDESLGTIEITDVPNQAAPDPEQQTAIILVGGYSGLGVHTLLNAVRFMPHYYKSVVFISVGVIDSGNFKGVEELGSLKKHVEASLLKYVDLARRLGFASVGYMAFGTDVVDELERLCRVAHRDFPNSVVFAGQLVFQRETWYGALLHNQTAFSLQRRLQWDGIQIVILPTRVRES